MEIYHPGDDELLREMRRVRRADRRRRLAWGLSVLLILALATGWFVFNRYYQLAVIHGPAMGDTLPDGSLVLVRKPEPGVKYISGDIILYEKRMAKPVDITLLSPKGKIRNYCRYILYRDVGTTRQYYSTADGAAAWIENQAAADIFEADQDGTLHLDTHDLKNGEYWLKEVEASYGQDVLPDPFSFTVNNSVQTQMKRVLAAPGERVVLSPYAETRVNGRVVNTDYTSGRTLDASVDGRRVIAAQDHYFVQGDHLSLSVDSRDTDYSTVSADSVLGRAEFALWPIRCFGDLTGKQTTVSGTEAEEAE